MFDFFKKKDGKNKPQEPKLGLNYRNGAKAN